MNFLHEDLSNQNKNSLFLNNNNFNMDKHTSNCPSKSPDQKANDEFQNINEAAANDAVDSDENENQVNSDSDEMFVNSYDDLPVSEDDDVQLSSPSNSLNSDVDQRWYAFRGRWGVNMMDDNHNDINNRQMDNPLPVINQQPPQQQQQQEEEETDFLEMDFEPDTNSEIENEAKFSDYILPNGHQHNASNTNAFNFLNHAPQLPQSEYLLNNLPPLVPSLKSKDEAENFIRPVNKNTGAKPKQLSSALSRPPQRQTSKQVSDGDNIFKITSTLNNNINDPTSSLYLLSNGYINTTNSNDEVYNLGASSSRSALQTDTFNHSHKHDANIFMKVHKSPSKSSNHHNHKHLRLFDDQNDQFLYEIEPLKPRNSVTIYTTNCDEKILIDALMSLNLEPNREIISSYFNRSKPSTLTTPGTANNCELNLIDYIIYRSKLNCNYLKLIELIQKSCKCESEDSYSDKKMDINFYPLDLFSTTPEMIEVEVNEIVQRWTPQSDLSQLINIQNKYFYQTNVLGKIVNIIRKINQTPPATFKDKETIKIPQFYVSGYITITTNAGFPSSS
ncbi:CLUMA_CG017349, isoform A [Clunio marinus]|uniref:CLUMA_CG017349, isoform A n=1 Tax=Clunio marinus TaxID=568069 RepID=A0A1J1IVP3_9DIPT|nr:CLUMA_CG017349, isoform A [Clunio marinus]